MKMKLYVATLSVLLMQNAFAAPATTKPHPLLSINLAVEAVHDGDTFSTHLGGLADKVRMLGIDAPELVQPRWGPAAQLKLSSLILHKTVRAEVDEMQPRDAYGRILAYVYLAVIPNKELMVQQEMLSSGMAIAKAYGKPPRGFDLLTALENEAKARHTGIWSDPTFISPDTFRHTHGVGR